MLTFGAGLLTAIVVLVGAWIALARHFAQVKADTECRITESFTKAVEAIEQLGSDKLQVRLGSIYALERISRESKLDYWPIPHRNPLESYLPSGTLAAKSAAG